MTIKSCVFDAYGTLFDVAAAARNCAAEPQWSQLGGRWQRLAGDWRSKQLQYTWLRAVTGDHTDFWNVTGEALDWSLEASGLDGQPGIERKVAGSVLGTRRLSGSSGNACRTQGTVLHNGNSFERFT